ncbi:hypothetical protein E5288_WYG005790 [Bos mutus]|uniref:Uncharacterized protein n=1 Tax=Bos mutus TaxID=72004 RepID=A0A6B0QVX0_9CETA|nr:hypothetical protein [Bos mutus]
MDVTSLESPNEMATETRQKSDRGIPLPNAVPQWRAIPLTTRGGAKATGGCRELAQLVPKKAGGQRTGPELV